MGQKVKTIVYVISRVDYALGFDWLEQALDRSCYKPVFIFLNDTRPALVDLFKSRGVDVEYIELISKKSYPAVFFKLLKLFARYKPDIVHAHLFDANLLAIPAAKLMGVRKRMYTRHHSTYHFDYHPHMVKYDKFINSLCTEIVSISKNVSDVLENREGVPESKIKLVNHGFDLEKFIHPDKIAVAELEAKYNPSGKRPVVGVISRLTEWKGVQYIIPAFKDVLTKYPDAVLLIANAKGDYESQIRSQLKELEPEQYVLIPFEKDLFSLYALMDVFVHVPVDEAAEAFGQVYIEPLAAGIPCVFTLSGIAREFVVDGVNALVVPFKDSQAIRNAVLRLLEDKNLAQNLKEQGVKDVISKFTVAAMMSALYRAYEA